MASRHSKQSSSRWHWRWQWLAAVLAAALASAALTPGVANAAGLFDFLFGGPQQRPAPPAPVESYAEPSMPVRPAPLGPESVRQSADSTGHGVAFCVRLCDGQHFPLEHMANATPVETCRAMCPTAKTKVYFGSEIGASVAKDGARYADLDTAFIYRKQLVANCTCNGKDALGLAHFDMSSDPTLQPGDIVATKQGLMAFTGRNGAVAQFTPVNSASIRVELDSVTSRVASTKRAAPAASHAPAAAAEPDVEDDPGTIAMPQQAPPPVNVGSNLRGQQR